MCYFIISYYMYIHNRDFFLIFMYICYYKLYLYKPFVWKASFQRREDVQTRYRQSAPANWWLIKFWSGCWCACAVRFYVRYAVSLGPFSVSRKGCVVANPTTGRRYFFISVAIGGITLCAWPLLFVFVRTCNARRPWYAGTNYFTPARAVYAVVILCVLSWDIGHQSVDDTAFRSYYLIYSHIYIYRARVRSDQITQRCIGHFMALVVFFFWSDIHIFYLWCDRHVDLWIFVVSIKLTAVEDG